MVPASLRKTRPVATTTRPATESSPIDCNAVHLYQVPLDGLTHLYNFPLDRLNFFLYIDLPLWMDCTREFAEDEARGDNHQSRDRVQVVANVYQFLLDGGYICTSLL